MDTDNVLYDTFVDDLKGSSWTIQLASYILDQVFGVHSHFQQFFQLYRDYRKLNLISSLIKAWKSNDLEHPVIHVR